MIAKAALVAWIVSLPVIRDGHGLPIPRPTGFADAIATVALEHEELDARVLSAMLDVVAAHESAYRVRALGDGGRSKGAWQTPAAETPDDAMGQARIAAKWLIVSAKACPDFPLSRYATGHVCGSVRIADRYWREVRAELAIPFEAP